MIGCSVDPSIRPSVSTLSPKTYMQQRHAHDRRFFALAATLPNNVYILIHFWSPTDAFFSIIEHTPAVLRHQRCGADQL